MLIKSRSVIQQTPPPKKRGITKMFTDTYGE